MLSSDIIFNIASFLPNKQKHNISLCNKYQYSSIAPNIIYSYNEYIKTNPKNNDLFMRNKFMRNKWSVKHCHDEMLKDIIKKNINIHSLSFYYGFNQSIKTLKLLSLQSLHSLSFGEKFNQSIEVLQHCKLLQSLRFGILFNQSIEVLQYLQELRSLEFDSSVMSVCYNGFNQSINSLQNLRKLQSLKFGFHFNQSIKPLENLK